MKETKADVGVIVGRFQVHELHGGHSELIHNVCLGHSKVIVFLGVSKILGTKNNPLDFESRKQLIIADFPNAMIIPIEDMRDDTEWSKNLDAKIEMLISPMQTVALYGSRDSFVMSYNGKHKNNVVEMASTSIVSGSAVRNEIRNKVIPTSAFRAGAIWATSLRYPMAVPTVDIAIYDKATKQFLFAKKPGETQLRFVGGFVSPNDDSLEYASKREATEETGLELSIVDYVGSFIVDDWRYRGEQDKIMTSLFLAVKIYGNAVAQDDIECLSWVTVKELKNLDFVDGIVHEHVPLFHRLRQYIDNNNLRNL